MGEAKRKRSATERFLERHPFCCLCGGTIPATTIEHAPPSVFFIEKQLPSGSHRVPACDRCNHGSSQQDQVAALAAMTMASAHRYDLPDGYCDKLIKGVSNNAPDAFRAMSLGVDRAKKFLLRVNGLLRESYEVEIDRSLFTDWLEPWAAKQAYALHYLHTGEIVPPTARVLVGWYSNADLVEGRSPERLMQALPNIGELRQGVKTSGIQFSYKWQVEGQSACFLLLLQDASIAMTGILRDIEAARPFFDAPLFATDPTQGIHRATS